MKHRKGMIWLVIASVIVLPCVLLYSSQTTYELAICNLEMVFDVVDAKTHEPIPNATIKLVEEKWGKRDEDLPVIVASAAGLLGSPLGQGPLFAASALIPGKTNDVCLKIITLTTNSQGRADYFRENNTCEYTVRPFRKTRTAISLGWASVFASAKGYQPTEEIDLGTYKYEYQGYFPERHSHRLVFHITLQKPGETP